MRTRREGVEKAPAHQLARVFKATRDAKQFLFVDDALAHAHRHGVALNKKKLRAYMASINVSMLYRKHHSTERKLACIGVVAIPVRNTLDEEEDDESEDEAEDAEAEDEAEDAEAEDEAEDEAVDEPVRQTLSGYHVGGNGERTFFYADSVVRIDDKAVNVSGTQTYIVEVEGETRPRKLYAVGSVKLQATRLALVVKYEQKLIDNNRIVHDLIRAHNALQAARKAKSAKL